MFKNKLTIVASLIYLVFTGWWIYLAINGLQGETDSAERFSATYGSMALFGGVVGLLVSKKWGGFKSLIGKSIGFISLGLLAQVFGQIAYSFYTYRYHIEIPYPSVGDIGYFGSVILYAIALFFMIKALSVRSTFSSKRNIFIIVLLPALLLIGSYAMFLKGYSACVIDEETMEKVCSTPVQTFLDFGYPLGQAFYISLALLAFSLSKKFLGGVMKPVIWFLIIALIAQYASDFTFLYQDSRDLWKTGGINELMYLSSYLLMTLALIHFGSVLHKLKSNDKSTTIDTEVKA